MNRYIEDTEALRVLSEYYHHRTDLQKYVLAEAISQVPTADVAEVVRCADCRHLQCNMRLDGTLPKGVDEYECRHWCGSCDPIDFCSHGERKEAEVMYYPQVDGITPTVVRKEAEDVH